MKRLILTSLILVLAMSASAEIVFVDINDAPAEINACQDGLNDRARKTGFVEPPIEKTSGKCQDPNGTIFPKDAVQRAKQSDTYWCLRHKIGSMLAQGRRIDSLVISGEDGSGHFFGANGDFYASELQQLYRDYPQLNQTLQSAALWGCYPTSVHGAEQFWMTPNPAMKFTMGFTIQGPDKTREANHDLLRQFCERREEAVQASTTNELCRFYDSIRQITRTNLGMCNQTSVASMDYAYPGMEEANHCFTYEDLKARCGEFIQGFDKHVQMYEDYRSGARDDFEKNANGGLSDLRKFYNQIQLWRHCTKQFNDTRDDYDMPYAPDLIRLIKYNKLAENIMKMNGPQLAQYDVMLQNMGLGAFKLGDITKIPRRELVAKIQQVIVALERLEGGANSVTVDGVASTTVTTAPEPKAETGDGTLDGGGGFMFSDEMFDDAEAAAPAPVVVQPASAVTVSKDANGMVNNVNTATALRMAQCLRQALVNTSSLCTKFNMVSDHAKTPSKCVISYKRAGELNQTPKGPNDAC